MDLSGPHIEKRKLTCHFVLKTTFWITLAKKNKGATFKHEKSIFVPISTAMNFCAPFRQQSRTKIGKLSETRKNFIFSYFRIVVRFLLKETRKFSYGEAAEMGFRVSFRKGARKFF